MILMLGPAGAGKSLQGQILALRHGWKWFSMGAALRQHATPEIQVLLDQGKIVPNHITNDLAARLFHEEADLRHLIVDGYPRNMEQAGYLVDYLSGRDGGSPNVVMVLDIGKEEVLRRLRQRGRSDDNDEAIAERLAIFAREGQAIIDFLAENGFDIERVAAGRTVGQVHDQIDEIICRVLQ
ncbi:nucleoside monophosphate kinase [Candidatus Saccharibacteria bacterium]|nr:nucleoside monophosphate kinase [Candidatus Saccharibacteria bacterium]